MLKLLILIYAAKNVYEREYGTLYLYTLCNFRLQIHVASVLCRSSEAKRHILITFSLIRPSIRLSDRPFVYRALFLLDSHAVRGTLVALSCLFKSGRKKINKNLYNYYNMDIKI